LGVTGEKLNALTGLRFIAAALIVVHHSGVLRIPVPPYALDHGVSLFFVLSGFILAYVYPRLDEKASVKEFLIVRVARIWPAHAFTLVLAAVFAATALGAPFDGPRFFANLVMVHAWIPSSPWYFSFNAPSWSISTEFFFYLAFPLLIWHWHQTGWWKWLASAGVVGGLVFLSNEASLSGYSTADTVTSHGLLFISPLARLFEFVTGMAACSCWEWLRPRTIAIGVAAASMVELSVFAITAYFIMEVPTLRYAVRYLDSGIAGREWLAHTGSVVVFPALIMVLASGLGMISRLLSTRLAVFLGEISYSVYLTHVLVFTIYVRYWMPAGTAPDYRGWALCIAATLTSASLIWKFVETPARSAVKSRLRLHASTQVLPQTTALSAGTVGERGRYRRSP
jgi:peptidoglycan/LPS O-acetylase OafA/YrhL